MIFDDFWKLYPHRVGKGAAQKAWDKIKPDEETCRQIEIGLDIQKRYRRDAQAAKQFVPEWPYPATWLNQQRWLDEVGSHSDLKDRQHRDKCQTNDCQGDALQYGYCVECDQLMRHKGSWREGLLRNRFISLGIPYVKGKMREPCLKAIYAINPVIARMIGRG